MQISSISVVQASSFDAHFKRRTNKFQVSIYSVYILVSEVKLNHTYDDRFQRFSQLIFKVSVPRTITLM